MDAVRMHVYQPGFLYTFDKPRIYPYFCDAHAQWNSDIKRVEARQGSSEYPAAMEGVVFVLP